MRVLRFALAGPSFEHVMIWIECCTAFVGLLQVSEFTCSGFLILSRYLALTDVQHDVAVHYHCEIIENRSISLEMYYPALVFWLLHSPIWVTHSHTGFIPDLLSISAEGSSLSVSFINNAWCHSRDHRAITEVTVFATKTLGWRSSDCYLRYIRLPFTSILQSAHYLLWKALELGSCLESPRITPHLLTICTYVQLLCCVWLAWLTKNCMYVVCMYVCMYVSIAKNGL